MSFLLVLLDCTPSWGSKWDVFVTMCAAQSQHLEVGDKEVFVGQNC